MDTLITGLYGYIREKYNNVWNDICTYWVQRIVTLLQYIASSTTVLVLEEPVQTKL